MLPSWEEEERIARWLKKYRQRMAYDERSRQGREGFKTKLGKFLIIFAGIALGVIVGAVVSSIR
jgi:hypothetical protein